MAAQTAEPAGPRAVTDALAELDWTPRQVVAFANATLGTRFKAKADAASLKKACVALDRAGIAVKSREVCRPL